MTATIVPGFKKGDRIRGIASFGGTVEGEITTVGKKFITIEADGYDGGISVKRETAELISTVTVEVVPDLDDLWHEAGELLESSDRMLLAGIRKRWQAGVVLCQIREQVQEGAFFLEASTRLNRGRTTVQNLMTIAKAFPDIQALTELLEGKQVTDGYLVEICRPSLPPEVLNEGIQLIQQLGEGEKLTAADGRELAQQYKGAPEEQDCPVCNGDDPDCPACGGTGRVIIVDSAADGDPPEDETGEVPLTFEMVEALYAEAGMTFLKRKSGSFNYAAELTSDNQNTKVYRSIREGFIAFNSNAELRKKLLKKHPAGAPGSAKSSERYTPEFIWSRALKAAQVEQFDLDPATYKESPIPAKRIFTREDNGLTQSWVNPDGTPAVIWLNPPYHGESDDGEEFEAMPLWCDRLITTYEAGKIQDAYILVKSDCRPEWFKSLFESATAYCFLWGAVKFGCPDLESEGKKATGSFFGSIVFYFGADVDRFHAEYSDVGGIGQRLEPGMFGE